MGEYSDYDVTDFVKEYGIKADVSYGAPPSAKNLPIGQGNMDPWTIVLKRTTKDGKKRRMTVPFYTGYGLRGTDPTAADALNALASDASGFENAQGMPGGHSHFLDWAAEFGYEWDSEDEMDFEDGYKDNDYGKALLTYNAVDAQTKKLKAFLGGHLAEKLMYETEGL